MQLEQAANHQPGPRQQHQRKRDLADEQRGTASIACRKCPADFPGRVTQSWRCGLQGRNDAEDHAGEQCRDGHEHQHARVDGDLVRARKVGRMKPVERRQQPTRHHDAGGGTNTSKQHAFGQQLPEQPAAIRAECRPYDDLATTRRRAHHEQICDVGAGDQQDESHGAEQHDETESYVFHQHVVGASNRDVGIAGAVGGGDVLRDALEIGRRAFDRHVIFQPGNDRQHMRAAPDAFVGSEDQRRIEIDRIAIREFETRWHDANDGEGGTVQRHQSPNHRFVSAEPALPEVVREDDDAIAALLFFLREDAAEHWIRRQHAKQAARH